jgi:membrane protein
VARRTPRTLSMTPAPRPPRPSLRAAARGALDRVVRDSWGFIRRVYHKSGQDDIFFLAGGIAFNILLGAVPFLLLLVAIFGFVLKTTVPHPEETAVAYVFTILPASPEIEDFVRLQIKSLVENETQVGIFGIILLVWVSTRLIGSVRSAMRNIFDTPETRGIVGGKIFDAQMVVVAGSLFLANTAITVILEAVQTYGIELVGLSQNGTIETLRVVYAQLLAWLFIFLMFGLMYRYLPARRIPWRVAIISAIFSSVVFEMLKSAFAWYIAYVANYRTTYGYLVSWVVLIFWIYYSALVFVLGGEVGQVYATYRTRQRQRELLD